MTKLTQCLGCILVLGFFLHISRLRKLKVNYLCMCELDCTPQKDNSMLGI
jgi:hypothetical protein